MFSIVKVARDQTQPGSLLSRLGGKMRDPGNEVGPHLSFPQMDSVVNWHLLKYALTYHEQILHGYFQTWSENLGWMAKQRKNLTFFFHLFIINFF